MKSKTFRLSAALLAVALIALLGLMACTSASTTPTSTTTTTLTTTSSTTTTLTTTTVAKTIAIMHNATLGDYLVDGNGMTLYYFTKDSPGVSNASAAVIANWPVFFAAAIILPAELNAADFGTITRSDGLMQTTFRGWPLYYFIKDKVPGDTTGQGVNNVWYVVNPGNFHPVTTTTTTSTTTSTTTTTTTSTATTTTTSTTTAVTATINLVAKSFAFDKSSITVPAGAQVTINFDNQDSGIQHNFALYTNTNATSSIFVGQGVVGPAQTTYNFTAPGTPGTYFFRCDFHPTMMTGSFIVQ